MNRTVGLFIPNKAHKQNLPPYQHKVCAPIWNISHIVSSLLHCGLQNNDKCRTNYQSHVSLLTSNRQRKKQLGQCLNLMEWQTVVGFRQNILFRVFEGPRGEFDASRQVLDLVACLIFFFWVAWTNFCKVYLLFSLLFHHEDLALGLGLAQSWYLMMARHSRSERRKMSRTGWWLIAGIYRSRVVHRSSIFVFWGQKEIIWSEDVFVKRKEACRPEAISRYFACCSSFVCISE
jgi:hypothetical protein